MFDSDKFLHVLMLKLKDEMFRQGSVRLYGYDALMKAKMHFCYSIYATSSTCSEYVQTCYTEVQPTSRGKF